MNDISHADSGARPGYSDFLNDWSMRAEEAGTSTGTDRWRKLALYTAIVGIVFVVLYLVSFLLVSRVPLGKATDAEILAYYGDGTNLTLTLAGMLVLPFVGITFLYFATFLRAMAVATGLRFSKVLSNVQWATAIIFIAMLFVATAGLVAMPAGVQFASLQTDPLAARILPLLSIAVLLGFGMRMASMFVFSSSSIGRATGLIPSWFAFVGYGVGVVLLLAYTVAAWFALLFPAWVLALCIIILWRRAKAG